MPLPTITGAMAGAHGAFRADIVGIAYIIVVALTWLAHWKWSQVAGLGALILVDVWAFVPTV